jgi:integrase/recombinase XerD
MGGKSLKPLLHSSKPAKYRHKWLATLLAKVLRGPDRKPANTPSQPMTLHTVGGGRKYLTASERQRFAAAAGTLPIEPRLFCLLLMWSGCRISEALAVTALSIDRDGGTVAFVTLKRRRSAVVRQVPIPGYLVADLTRVFDLTKREKDAYFRNARLWRWSRSSAWRYVKVVMKRAGLSGSAAMPKGLRHTFGVAAFQAVPPHIVQRWLGHASLRTTGIYGDVSGREEQQFAERIWESW